MALGIAGLATGCGRIGVAPTCPTTLAVGESGTVSANPINPGAIPTYQWEVVPTEAGTFADPNAARTTFEAALARTVVLRLTASDTIYLAFGECTIEVVASSGVAVVLQADVATPVVDTTVTLTCRSVGETAAFGTSFLQTAGTAVTLTPVAAGQVTFSPQETGDYTFQCTGTSPGGAASEPSELTITVVDSGGGRPPRR